MGGPVRSWVNDDSVAGGPRFHHACGPQSQQEGDQRRPGNARSRWSRNRAMSPLRALTTRLLASTNPFRMDPRLDRLVERLCATVPPASRVLNLGAGKTDFEGPVLNLDLEPFPGVDVVA